MATQKVELTKVTFDDDLLGLYNAGQISRGDALQLQQVRHLGTIAGHLAILAGVKTPAPTTTPTTAPTTTAATGTPENPIVAQLVQPNS
jgi:hypothetical protein